MIQPFPAGGLRGAVSPQRGPGQSPEANAFWQQSIENWLKISSLGRRLHPNYSNCLENIISSSMYDTTYSKLLGVHIDNKLDFGHHVSHKCQKAGKQVKVLSRLSRVLNESNKLLLYSSFISCYFNYYCCVLWHFCNNSDTLKIEKLQEKALRYYILDFKSPYQQLLLNCGKSTLFLQRLQKLMEVIYRILNGLYPSYLNDIITVEELQHLRCRSRLFIPPFSTVRYGKKSLSYLSPVLWKSLGNDIKQCDVLTAFKKRIKLWKGPTCNCGFCAQCRISNR